MADQTLEGIVFLHLGSQGPGASHPPLPETLHTWEGH
jgi:hypothetical protein